MNTRPKHWHFQIFLLPAFILTGVVCFGLYFFGTSVQSEAGQPDNKPPVIAGTGTIYTYLADPVLYLQGVEAYDDLGSDLTDSIIIDTSAVDLFSEGIYTVIYNVEDLNGLLTEVEENVHVIAVDPEQVNKKVDVILKNILSENMTQLDKIKAIYSWVGRNVFYAGTNNSEQSVYESAYFALIHRKGDCHVFYSISEVMLTRAGIPNMPIERIPGTPLSHRWSLVNPDELGWHHYDSLTSQLGLGFKTAFFTDSQAMELAGQILELDPDLMLDYYTYDPKLYPEVVQ